MRRLLDDTSAPSDDPGAEDPPSSPGDPTAGPGVGPYEGPWPDDPRLDPELLAAGDRRNVLDRYRYWRLDAIVADLDTRRAPLHVAIQNWEHDFNIGSIVRTANAFNVAAVHIVGRRRWNRRGAMVTDRYLHVEHHADVEGLVDADGAAGADAGRRRQPAGLGAARAHGAAALLLPGLRLRGPRA